MTKLFIQPDSWTKHKLWKNKPEQRSSLSSDKIDLKERGKTDTESMPDACVRHLRDQLIRAKVFLGLSPIRNNPHYARELRLRIREVQRVVGDATKDSELPRNANENLKAMEQTLAKSKQIQDDCTVVIKNLHAILHSTEEQLRVHKKQTLFLTQLAANSSFPIKINWKTPNCIMMEGQDVEVDRWTGGWMWLVDSIHSMDVRTYSFMAIDGTWIQSIAELLLSLCYTSFH